MCFATATLHLSRLSSGSLAGLLILKMCACLTLALPEAEVKLEAAHLPSMRPDSRASLASIASHRLLTHYSVPLGVRL